MLLILTHKDNTSSTQSTMPPKTHAISLYGTPKYLNFIAFDYANPNAPKGGQYKQGIIGRLIISILILTEVRR